MFSSSILGGVALFHVRGAENVRRRTFWLGAISPPFGLVQRPTLAHSNRSDTVDILSITFYSFILGDLDPTVAIESSIARFELHAPLSGAHSRARRGRGCPHEGNHREAATVVLFAGCI